MREAMAALRETEEDRGGEGEEEGEGEGEGEGAGARAGCQAPMRGQDGAASPVTGRWHELEQFLADLYPIHLVHVGTVRKSWSISSGNCICSAEIHPSMTSTQESARVEPQNFPVSYFANWPRRITQVYRFPSWRCAPLLCFTGGTASRTTSCHGTVLLNAC